MAPPVGHATLDARQGARCRRQTSASGTAWQRWNVVKCLMRLTYDDQANAAYLALEDIAEGTAVENVVVGRPGRGDVILDFDADGRLLGVEVIGATLLLRTTVLDASERL